MRLCDRQQSSLAQRGDTDPNGAERARIVDFGHLEQPHSRERKRADFAQRGSLQDLTFKSNALGLVVLELVLIKAHWRAPLVITNPAFPRRFCVFSELANGQPTDDGNAPATFGLRGAVRPERRARNGGLTRQGSNDSRGNDQTLSATIVKNFNLCETFGSPAWLLDPAVRFEHAASIGRHPRNRPIVSYVRFLRCLNLREAPRRALDCAGILLPHRLVSLFYSS